MSAAANDDDIRMIRHSAGAVAPRGGDLKRIRALRFQRPGVDRTIWEEMCALGWIGLRVPEHAGGAGLGMRAFCALAEELGAGLLPEPLVAGAMAAGLLRGQSRAETLSGKRIILPAWQERANTLDVAGDATCAHGRVSGRKLFVPMAAAADAFVVTTRDGSVLVDANGDGVHQHIEMTQDGGHFGTLTLAEAPCEPVSGDASDALEEAALATAATLLGVMDGVFAITLDYLRTRHQFGRAIGGFQGLQHRAADLKLQIELTRSSVASAAATLDSGAPQSARRAAVSRAKARASDAALLVTRQAIQLHGGIGYTDEHDCGLYLRRAMVLANLYGSAALHRARFAKLAPETEDV